MFMESIPFVLSPLSQRFNTCPVPVRSQNQFDIVVGRTDIEHGGPVKRGGRRVRRVGEMSGDEKPTQIELDESWDRALETSIRSVLYSSMAGTAAAYALFRTPGSRKLVMGIGFGFGLGNAYQATRGELSGVWSRLFQGSP